MDLELKSISQILDEARAFKAKLLVIEMFSYLLHEPESQQSICAFMGAAQRAISQEGMTIIGTMEAPKMRPKDVYKDPRQRISGRATWGHTAETIFLVEKDPKKPEDSRYRILSVHTRNGKAEIFPAEFRNDGQLHLISSAKKRTSSED